MQITFLSLIGLVVCIYLAVKVLGRTVVIILGILAVLLAIMNGGC